jgi:hypothetical protein
MAVIETQRNRVITEPPEADDVFVWTSLLGPADGEDLFAPRVLTSHNLPLRPITEYQAELDFAVSIADQFAFPLYVAPMNANEFLRGKRFKPYQKFLATMNEQEGAEVTQIIVNSCAEIMRDSPDRAVRADAYNILVQLKVVQQ